MKRFLGFASALVLLVLPVARVQGQQSQEQSLTFGQRVNVTPDEPGWIQDEFSADADPSNPGRMIYCIRAFDQSTDSIRGGAYVSFDNGKTWAHTLDAGRNPGYGWSDPACAYGLNGE